jgi:hypothetical protein
MKIRFQADADLKQAIVAAVLRHEPSIDFQTADEAELKGVDDVDVLAIAAQEGRILVSHDKKTMPQHFAAFIQNNTSPGVFIVPQHLAIALAAEELFMIWYASESEEWSNRIVHLPL